MNACQQHSHSEREHFTLTVVDAVTDRELYHEHALGCDVVRRANQLHYAYATPTREVYIHVTDSDGNEVDW